MKTTRPLTILALSAAALLSITVSGQARQLIFYWTPQTDATSHRVETRLPGGKWTPLQTVTGKDETDSAELPDVPFEVRAIAINDAGLESEPSNTLAVGPSPAPPAGMRVKVSVVVEAVIPPTTISTPAKK